MAKIMIDGVEKTAIDFCMTMIDRHGYDARAYVEQCLIDTDANAWRKALNTFSLTIVDTVEYFLLFSDADVEI